MCTETDGVKPSGRRQSVSFKQFVRYHPLQLHPAVKLSECRTCSHLVVMRPRVNVRVSTSARRTFWAALRSGTIMLLVLAQAVPRVHEVRRHSQQALREFPKPRSCFLVQRLQSIPGTPISVAPLLVRIVKEGVLRSSSLERSGVF